MARSPRARLTQKWPPIEVMAAAPRPPAFRRCDQPREDVGLAAGILLAQVAAHLPHIGMGDGELERDGRSGMPLDQATIIEVGRGRADAADQSDVHEATFAHCRAAATQAGGDARAVCYLCVYAALTYFNLCQ